MKLETIKCPRCGERHNLVYSPLMKASKPPVVMFTCAVCFAEFRQMTDDLDDYDVELESLLNVKTATKNQLKVYIRNHPNAYSRVLALRPDIEGL